MKTFVISLFSLILFGCASLAGYPGYYSIAAYDANGNSLDGGSLFVSAGSTIHTTLKGTCSAFPGATLIIKNTQTGEELAEESPYQCKGKKAEIIRHRFASPAEINFSGNVYKLAYRAVQKDRAIYEYTSNNEKIEHWKTLITLAYSQHADVNTPASYADLVKNAFGEKVKETSIVGDHAYAQVIFEPGENHPYYESAIKKSFHISYLFFLVKYNSN